MVTRSHNTSGSKNLALLPSNLGNDMSEGFICAICERRINSKFFCWKCYSRFKKEILSKEKWVRYLYNKEAQRRYLIRRTKEGKLPRIIRLGNKWDIGGNNKLIVRNGYNGQA